MILIAGAGISGLTAARYLEAPFLLFEKTDVLGGLATQYPSGDYWFDYAGHYFHFLNKEEIKTIVESICPFKRFNRSSKTFAVDRYIPFPLQYHLGFLPAKYRKAVLQEISQERTAGKADLYEYLSGYFGETLFQLFFNPFLGKYYGVDLHEMVADMDKGSIPPPDIPRMQKSAERRVATSAGYNPVFYYPTTSLRHFIARYAAGIPADALRMNETIVEVDVREKRVTTTGGTYRYDRLITSLPLKELLAMIKPVHSFPAPETLSHTSTLLANVILKEKRKRFHWVYIADRKLPFYRVGFYPIHPYPAAYMERTVTKGFEPHQPEIRNDIALTLKSLGLVRHSDEIVHIDIKIIPISYVLFTHQWPRTVPTLLETLKEYGIYSIGRFGTWNYTSMSDDIKTALACAREINASASM